MCRWAGGFTFVCFDHVRFRRPTPITASLQMFVARAGWQDDVDEVQVWADINSESEDREFVESFQPHLLHHIWQALC